MEYFKAYRIGSFYKDVAENTEENKKRLIKFGYKEEEVKKSINKTVTKEYQKTKENRRK